MVKSSLCRRHELALTLGLTESYLVLHLLQIPDEPQNLPDMEPKLQDSVCHSLKPL